MSDHSVVLKQRWMGIDTRLEVESIQSKDKNTYLLRGRLLFQQEGEWVMIGWKSRTISYKKLLELTSTDEQGLQNPDGFR